MKKTFAAVTLAFLAGAAMAQSSPVGLWKTIDDDGKTEKSLVRITENNGVLSGAIEKVFDVSKQNDVCQKCEDDRKNKPIVGLQIIRGVHQDADDKTLWTEGTILDPENGKTYKTRLMTLEGGKKLQMRGYIGFFYRTQVWVRVE
ncbi:MAG: DUF2147 domain-containing protein [Burkholderiales bacterium]|nr:DUF2147 domain-containing protein [Burkholderiales bacterium]